jgi:purine-nucleoside phosphorylase
MKAAGAGQGSGAARNLIRRLERAAAIVRRACPAQPALGMVLGSGFYGADCLVEAARRIPFGEVPGFAATTVPGHKGEVVTGTICGRTVVLLSGRVHGYEGHPLAEITFPIRVLAALGIRALVLTNAAGSINPRFAPGDFMVLKDHLNFMGSSPLSGPAWPGLSRFVDLSCVYDPELRRVARAAARAVKVRLHEGIYAAVPGPNYETPAEVRALELLGADVVGMSTVPEAIVARQYGLPVLALSCLTNPAAGLARQPLAHEDVLRVAAAARERGTRLLREWVRRWAGD